MEVTNFKGIILKDEPMKNYTTLKVGGNAEFFVQPASIEDLQTFMKWKPKDMPITILGEGSNMLVSDKGIKGAVIYLAKGCDNVTVEGNVIWAEAGANSGKVARAARTHELTGAEFLCGIPGSIGGALKMNAGAYNRETADILTEVEVLDDTGRKEVLTPSDLQFAYRTSYLPKNWVYIGAKFTLTPGNKEQIIEKMKEINRARSTSQPLNMPSSGSWFKNPVINGVKTNAWKVVDAAGCRGMKVGGAQVSEKHSNFFVNLGDAKAADFIELSKKVMQQVKERSNIELTMEVRVIGDE